MDLIKKESNFVEDLNDIKNFILTLKEVFEVCLNDLDYLYDKVDNLLK